MNKKLLPEQPRIYKKRNDIWEHNQVNNSFGKSDFALKVSEQQLKKQNTEFNSLNKEYLALNDELKESLKRIQRMNEDLIYAKDKLEESDRLKSAFLTNILHEIRTPMNAIIGFSDLLMETKLSKVKTEKFVKIINVSCRNLNTVLSDIIDISRIDANESIIEKEIVNINFLLNEINTTYKKQGYNKGIELIYDVKSEFRELECETDLNKVKQVLCILLNNALKFTQQGEVIFGFDIKENFIEFYVKDMGIGIAPKDQAIIFERFRQVDNTNTRLYGGNGLGLSIAKAYVEKLGGSIMVDSEPGKGSTFIFTIPFLHPANMAENDGKSINIKPSVNWAGKTILVVEDEVFNHTIYQNLSQKTPW